MLCSGGMKINIFIFLFVNLINRPDLSMRSGLFQLRRQRVSGYGGCGFDSNIMNHFLRAPEFFACGAMSGGDGPLRPPAIARGKNMAILYCLMVFFNTTPLVICTGPTYGRWA